jgi:hypothetical protein
MVDIIQRLKAQHPDDRNFIDSGSKQTSECIHVNPSDYASPTRNSRVDDSRRWRSRSQVRME